MVSWYQAIKPEASSRAEKCRLCSPVIPPLAETQQYRQGAPNASYCGLPSSVVLLSVAKCGASRSLEAMSLLLTYLLRVHRGLTLCHRVSAIPLPYLRAQKGEPSTIRPFQRGHIHGTSITVCLLERFYCY